MGRVRYLTVARVALEIVTKLTPEENAQFNRCLFQYFRMLENGVDKPELSETDSELLNLALQEAVEELASGYRTYVKRMTAALKDKNDDSLPDQRFINDTALIGQRPAKEEKESKDRREQIFDTFKPAGLEEGQKEEIIGRLKALGIEKADSGFWNTCFTYGYDAVDTALSRAETLGNSNLKYITWLIANG